MPSLLPWVASKNEPDTYSLALAPSAGGVSHVLGLWREPATCRWHWSIAVRGPGETLDRFVTSRVDGYKRHDNAERALMFKLHDIMHGK